MDLMQQLEAAKENLRKSLMELRKSSVEYAEAYTKYRVLLSQELVRLKDSGTPVTLAYDIARGNPEVSKAKFDEICTEGKYKANQEAINTYKIEVKLIENQIEREYKLGE